MCHMFYKRFPNDNIYREFLIDYKTGDKKAPYTEVCFSGYEYQYDGSIENGELYIGFYSNRKIEQLIKEINNLFGNIKVVLIDKFLAKWPGNSSYLKNNRWPNKYRFYTFKVVLDNKYSQTANYVLVMAMAQFIRIFCPEYSHYEETFGIKSDYINSTLKAFNNIAGKYGTWSGSEKWTLDEFKLLDDIEFINEITTIGFSFENMPYISRLHRNLVAQNKEKQDAET